VTPQQRADALAGALMVAPPASRDALWQQSREQPADELAWALKRLCDAAWTTDPPATLVAAGLLEQLAQARPGAEVEALAAWSRGIGQLSQGRMEAALAALEHAGACFLALGRPLDDAQTRIGRVMALAMLGRYPDAVACGLQAREVFDAAGDARASGKIELNLGNLAARRDLHADAAGHYGIARARFAAAEDAELEIMAIKGLADMLSRRHEFEPAQALYQQAQTRAERGGFALLTASIEGDLGALEMRRGRYDRALHSLERSRRAYAALEVPHYLAVAEESLADAYLELNLLPEALALYEGALATYEAAGLATDRAWALSQRGRALTLLGRHDAAAASLALAEQAFGDDGNTTGAALVQLWLAESALARGDWPAAVRHAVAGEAPLQVAQQAGWALHARNLQAEAQRAAGDAAGAETLALATCAAAEAFHLSAVLRRSQLLLGLLARDRGDALQARRCFEAVVASIESQRGALPGEEFRSAFLGDNLLPYRELVRACIDEGGAGAAEQTLHWVERARARTLADTAEVIGAIDGAEGDTPARRELLGLRLQLNDCYRGLARPVDDSEAAARLHGEARRIEALLLEAGRRSVLAGSTGGSGAGSATLDLPGLHAALGEHSALVEYFSLDDTLLACVVAAGVVNLVRLPTPFNALRSSIEQLRFQTDTLRHGAARMAHRMPELRARAQHHLQSLHAALWAPLAPHIGARRVVVVPHGALHYVPFEALHDGQQHEVERREICRAPSAAVLLHCLARPHRRFDSALVLGHADARLPHVPAEVEAVAAQFPRARALNGAAARGDALRAPGRADVLHIACHAQFRNDSPRFSALHLADGAFTVSDAVRLRLDGGLVTLSACETGISAVMPGDELIGLTHAFIAAGAARVLASLWTVQDQAAGEFMQGFYARLRAHGQPGQALRATQIETLQNHPHPYFWAAFTLHAGW